MGSIKVWDYIKGGKIYYINTDRPMRVMEILKATSTEVELFGTAFTGEGKALSLEDEVPPGGEVKLLPAIIGG